MCQASTACRMEYVRRRGPSRIRKAPEAGPGRACDVCGWALRVDNIYGVCDRTAECMREKRRRYYQRPGRPCRYADAGCTEAPAAGERVCATHKVAWEARRQRQEELAAAAAGDSRRKREEQASALVPCKVCGQPTASRYGVCTRTAGCRREAGRAKDRRYDARHPGARRRASREAARRSRAAKPKAPPPSPEEQAETKRQADLRWRAANRDAVREKDRKYLLRPGRPCRRAKAGCTEYALIGQRACAEHRKAADAQASARRRTKLATAQAWACTWCSTSLSADLSRTQVDHVIPVSRGGPDEQWNLQLLHDSCNRAKRDKLTPQALALAAERGISIPIAA